MFIVRSEKLKKIRVLHFELSDSVGGIESFLLNVYKNIDRNKYQFDFVTTANKPAFGKQLKELGGKIYKVPPYKNIIQYSQSITKIIKKGYDIVHIHKNSAANILPIIICHKFDGVKIITHSHNTAPSSGRISIFLHYINKSILFNYANFRLACSTEAGEWLYGNNKTSNFEVIRNGIMTEKYKFNEKIYINMREKLGIPENAIVIGHVGRFSAQKNHNQLIDIFNVLKNKCSNTYLLLIGDGELSGTIKLKVKELNLCDRVLFLGTRNDVAELMLCMDAFLLPSIYEGLPIVGVEAQAAGLPLFCSDTVSPEIEISDSIHWFSLKDDFSELCDIIIDTISKEKKNREDIRIRRNTQVKDRGYDINKTIRRLMQIYEKLRSSDYAMFK